MFETEFCWKLEDIISERLRGKLGDRPKRLERNEWVLEHWARSSSESRISVATGVKRLLKKDGLKEKDEYYESLSNMIQRLDMKEVYPELKGWFNRNYERMRERVDVGKKAIFAMAVAQHDEKPMFWNALLLQPPDEWDVPTYKGLVRCSPDEAFISLQFLYPKMKARGEMASLRLLIETLFHAKRNEGKRESLLEALQMKRKIKLMMEAYP